MASTRAEVLLVDDDPIFRTSLKILFDQFPDEWSCTIAGSVEESARLLATRLFDLIVVDVHLPDGTASDVIKASGTVACIVCTQDSETPTFQRLFADPAVSQNIVGYLIKPLQPGVIWSIRAGLRISYERQSRNRLVAEATANLEEERRQIAQNLHDCMGASLTQLTWLFSNIERTLKSNVGPDLPEKILEICEQGRQIVKLAHTEVSHVVTELRPEAVNVAGLDSAIGYLVDQWKMAAPGVRFELIQSGELDSVDMRRANILYRVVQEGVTNVMRHTFPNYVGIHTERRGENLVIVISSCGKAKEVKSDYKLTTLRERTSSLGGQLQFHLDQEREESRLTITIPV